MRLEVALLAKIFSIFQVQRVGVDAPVIGIKTIRSFGDIVGKVMFDTAVKTVFLALIWPLFKYIIQCFAVISID